MNDKIFFGVHCADFALRETQHLPLQNRAHPRRGYSKRQIILSFTIISQFGRKVNVLNVVFREDKLRSKEKKGIHNLGLIRRFVMFIIKLLKVYYHRSMKWVRNKNRKKSGNRDPCDLCQGIGCV